MCLSDKMRFKIVYQSATHQLVFTVLRSVVVTKLLYACSAWNGFVTASDRHRVDAFLRRSKRCGFCQLELPSFDQLMEDSDDRLFHKLRIFVITSDWTHTTLPSSTTTEHYNLRSASSHNRLFTCTHRPLD